MKKITLLLALTISCLVANATFYVVPAGAGVADGSSWANASGDIQTAINAASALVATEGAQEVWVKAGTYSTATAALIMKESVSLYGGFAGTEADKTLRTKGTNAWDYSNVSILDGGGAKRCIEVAANFSNVTTIDGFTITNGNGQGTQLNNQAGGVLLRNNLKLENCIVTGNTTTGNGGGVNAVGGIVSNCWVYNNTTTSTTIPAAGGIYSNANFDGGTVVVDGCLIEKNAQGAVRHQGAKASISMNNCIIRNNSSTAAGAAIYTNNPASFTITNSLITNNKGNNVVYLNKGQMINCTVANNEGGIYFASAANISEAYNCIVVNNVSNDGTNTPNSIGVAASYPAGKVKNNAVFPEIDGQTWGGATNTLLTTDETIALSQVAFVNPTSFIGLPADGAQLEELTNADWSLGAASLALNFGDNSLIPVEITTDLAGNARIVKTTVDPGAFETPYFHTTVTFNEGGTVNALSSGAILSEPKGKTMAFTITPEAGQKIVSVLYNSIEVKDDLVEGVYSTSALLADATLEVTFGLSTGIETQKHNFTCYSVGNNIEVRGLNAGEVVTLYSINGARIATQKSVNSAVRFTAQKGIYVVKVSDKVNKVVID